MSINITQMYEEETGNEVMSEEFITTDPRGNDVYEYYYTDEYVEWLEEKLKSFLDKEISCQDQNH